MALVSVPLVLFKSMSRKHPQKDLEYGLPKKVDLVERFLTF